MKRRTLIIGGIAGGVALAGAVALLSGTYNIEVSKQQIQEQLDKAFPIEKSAFVLSLKLENPNIILEDGAERLKFTVDAELGSPLQDEPAQGQAMISGKLRFDRDQGGFFFDDAKIEKFDVPGIPFEKFDGMANDAIKNFLDSNAIYTLDMSDWRQAIFRYTLRDIKIRKDTLILKMGLGF